MRHLTVVAVTCLLVALTSAACSTAPACTGAFTVDLPGDAAGAPDARAALDAWLDGTAPVGEAPASAPRGGWEETGTEAGSVVWESGDWRVTAWPTTRDEWVVTTLECV